MANPKNKTEEQTANGQVPNFDNWQEEQVGFAPYWNPEEEKWFYAQIIEKDERDPNFVRYLMRAGMDTPCKRGSDANQEDVLVKAGEYFTISVYYSLQGAFDFYLETGIRPFMKVIALKEVKTKTSGQTCWTWKLLVSPESKKQLEAARVKHRQMSDAGEFPPKELS